MNNKGLGKISSNKIAPSLLTKTVIALMVVMVFLSSQAVAGEFFYLTASWYAVKDLKSSGQWAITKGVMANGKQFSDEAFTCASRDYNLGTILRITNLGNGRWVIVEVTDRINKRFKGKRIDLTKVVFSKLDKLEKGIISVKVEVIK